IGSRDDRALPAFTVTVRVAVPTWSPDTPIQCDGILQPAAGSVAPGTHVTCLAGVATDTDKRVDIDGSVSFDTKVCHYSCCASAPATDQDKRVDSFGNVTYADDPCTYTWSCTGGAFLGGVNNQQQVTWVAPTVSGGCRLDLLVEDQKDANLPAGEGGSRTDP